MHGSAFRGGCVRCGPGARPGPRRHSSNAMQVTGPQGWSELLHHDHPRRDVRHRRRSTTMIAAVDVV